MIVETIRTLCPYPHLTYKGTITDGVFIRALPACHRCRSKDCSDLSSYNQDSGVPFDRFICESRLVSYKATIHETRFLVIGLYDPDYCIISDKPHRKKMAKERKVSLREVIEWSKKIEGALDRFETHINENVQEAIAPLHDLKPAVGILQRSVESLFKLYPGETIEQRIDNASDPSLVRVFKAASLLTSRLNLTSIVNNPKAASHGNKRNGSVYRLVHKFVRLFEPVAEERGIHIIMGGESYCEIPLYDSFESIPLILIDNAIKYSQPRGNINVEVEDKRTYISLSVSSIGEVVPPTERDRLFDRGFRGANAAQRGTGIGLYIANIVAQAHTTKIQYNSDVLSGIGTNEFKVALQK